VEAAFEMDPSLREKIVYGEDYVNLGFQSGNEFVILRMGESFKAMFPADIYNTPYDSIPVLKGVKNYSNVDYCMNFSAGKPGTQEWVQGAGDRFGLRLSAGNTAVQAPMMYPFLQGGQLDGAIIDFNLQFVDFFLLLEHLGSEAFIAFYQNPQRGLDHRFRQTPHQ